jgi:hypothetical protein
MDYGYSRPSANYFQSDVGTRIKRIRENRVIYNGIRDELAIDEQLANARNRPADVYYQINGRPILAGGELAGEMKKSYNYEIAMVHTDPRRASMDVVSTALFGMDSTLVPVFTVLNGFVAPSLAALMRNVRPIGMTELTGATTQAKGLTIIASGVTIGPNYTDLPFVTGDLLCAIPLTADKVSSLRGLEGEIANSAGRIPSILQPARNLNYYDPVDMRNAIWEELGLAQSAGGNIGFVRPGDKPTKGKGLTETFVHHDTDRRKRVLTRTHADEAFARSVVELIEFHAHGLKHRDHLEAAASGDDLSRFNNPVEDAEAFHQSAFLFLAATFYHPGTRGGSAKEISDFCQKFASDSADYAKLATTLAARIKSLLDAKPVADALFKKNPVRRGVSALMEHKLAQGKSMVGIAVTGCMPGGHSQMHLCRY